MTIWKLYGMNRVACETCEIILDDIQELKLKIKEMQQKYYSVEIDFEEVK